MAHLSVQDHIQVFKYFIAAFCFVQISLLTLVFFLLDVYRLLVGVRASFLL